MRSAVILSVSLVILTAAARSSSSLLPLDRWSSPLFERVPHPIRVLEHTPFGLGRDDFATVSPAFAAVDWKETPTAHVITIEVPGIKKEDLKIEVENVFLLVSGERKREEEKKGEKWHCVERVEGRFWRKFRLPENVEVNAVAAELEHGVLTITLPKLGPDRVKGPRVVSIAGGDADKESLSAGKNDGKKAEL